MIERVGKESQIRAKISEILEIYRSINENMMSAENYPTQKGEAVLAGVKVGNKIELYVHYFLYDNEIGLLYKETDPIHPQNYTAYRDAAKDSIESMGFMLENKNFRKLSEDQKIQLITSLRAFGGTGKKVGAFANSQTQVDAPSILILDETVHDVTSAPKLQAASAKAEATSIDDETWNLFFRFIASL